MFCGFIDLIVDVTLYTAGDGMRAENFYHFKEVNESDRKVRNGTYLEICMACALAFRYLGC